jgi:hypothetical protein
MPSAAARRSGGNASLTSVSVSGVTIAAPRPWSAAGDQDLDGWCDGGDRARAGEDADADREHQPAAEPVAEGRAGHE